MQPTPASTRRPTAIVALGFLLMFGVYAPNINLVGLFVSPMAQSFGVSRTSITLVLTIFTLTSTVTYLFAGRLLARYKMNILMAASLLLLALSQFGIAYTGSLPVLYLLSGVRGVCNSLLTVVPISMAVNTWVTASKNGKMLGIAMAGSGLGAMMLNPVTGYIIEAFGWRWGYRLYGVLSLALLLPVLLFFKLPAQKAPRQKAAGGRGLRSPALPTTRTRTVFFLLFFAYMFVAATTQSFNVNGASFLADSGFTTTAVASLLSLMSFGLIIGKVGLGWVCDKRGAKIGNGLSVSCIAGGYLLFILCTRLPAAALPAALAIGFGMATNTIVQPLTAGQLFDNRNYGVLVSYLQLGANFGSGLFPPVISRIYDTAGSYLPGWWLLCLMLVEALGLIFMAYRLQKKGTA